MSNLKSVKATAPLLNCAEITLRRLIKARRIPYLMVGCRYMFSDEIIQDYLRQVKVEPLAVGGEK
jgi:excisionase family DNA binding protein